MNYKLMLRIMGRALQVEALLLLLPLAVCLIYREDPTPFIKTIFPVLVIGTLLTIGKSKPNFFSQEGYAIVGLIWLILCLFGALPFWFSGFFGSYVDSLFEITSGFTTTGATILTDIGTLPRSLLFWRSFSSWIGGMGVLLFTLAFLPKVGTRTQVLMHAEVPGPIDTKLVPKTVQSSQILYMIYIVLTAAEIIAFLLAGMPLYDAVVTTFACICTGGFTITNASFAAYNAPCQIIAIVFMILSSLNYAVFFLTITGRLKRALKSDELRFFLSILTAASLLTFFSILPLYSSAGKALLDAVFQTTSILTTTGFCTANYDLWPSFSKTLLVLLMFIGGCTSSTSCSIKCGRILLLLRCSLRSVLRLIHPRSVKVVKLDGKSVDESTLNNVFAFFVLFFFLLGAGCVVISLDGFSLTTSFTAALGCLSNVGPGLEGVGPIDSFASLSNLSKATLSLFMLFGRLEIFPILLLFHPSTWERA